MLYRMIKIDVSEVKSNTTVKTILVVFVFGSGEKSYFKINLARCRRIHVLEVIFARLVPPCHCGVRIGCPGGYYRDHERGDFLESTRAPVPRARPARDELR